MIDIVRKTVSLDQNPWTHWTQAPIFEGTTSIPLFTEIQVPKDLPHRTIYLFVTTNMVFLGQNVYYATMNFTLKGQTVASELFRNSLASFVGDNRPNKQFLNNQLTVFTPAKNEMFISFPTLSNVVIAPMTWHVQCDAINFSINRQATLSGGTGRLYFACRSQTDYL